MRMAIDRFIYKYRGTVHKPELACGFRVMTPGNGNRICLSKYVF